MRELLKLLTMYLAFKQGSFILTHFYISADPLHSTQDFDLDGEMVNREEVDDLVNKHSMFRFSLPSLCSQYLKGFPV